MVAFEIKGGVEAGQAFVDALELFTNLANIGDVRSLVIHPASTTHTQLTPAEQLTTGVTPGLVRLAVGIEHIDDILADLEAGLPRREVGLRSGIDRDARTTTGIGHRIAGDAAGAVRRRPAPTVATGPRRPTRPRDGYRPPVRRRRAAGQPSPAGGWNR